MSGWSKHGSDPGYRRFPMANGSMFVLNHVVRYRVYRDAIVIHLSDGFIVDLPVDRLGDFERAMEGWEHD